VKGRERSEVRPTQQWVSRFPPFPGLVSVRFDQQFRKFKAIL